MLPVTGLRPGRNRLSFSYGNVISPAEVAGSKDRRRLAVAFDWLRFEGAAGVEPRADVELGQLVVPLGARIDYHLDAPGGARLEVAGLELRGGGAGGLRVEVTSAESGETHEVSLGAGASQAVELGAQGWVRLRLRAEPADGGSGGAWLLRDAAVRAVPPVRATRESEPVRAPERTPNLILYVVDTLRADHLGAYGYDRPVSPRLDAFAAESVLFERGLAQSSWTLPSMASVFSGLEPQSHGANGKRDRLASTLPTLPKLLKEAGFATGAVVANGYVSPTFGFAEGFDEFVFLSDVETRAAVLHERAGGWLDSIPDGAPFFLWLHAIDPHTSYDPPDEERRRFAAQVSDSGIGSRDRVNALLRAAEAPTPDLISDLVALYDAEIASTDRQFGHFVDQLKARGLYESSLIVFVSDHGEEFFDHGSWLHGHSLYGELLNVPLILRLPGGAGAGRRVAAAVQHVDLLPTLLDYYRLEPPDALHGRSLLPLVAADAETGPVFTALATRLSSVVLNRWKLIERPGRPGSFSRELFDLDRDPAERDNLAERRPIVAGYLASLIRARRLETVAVEAERAEIDEATLENLEALGYLN